MPAYNFYIKLPSNIKNDLIFINPRLIKYTRNNELAYFNALYI